MGEGGGVVSWTSRRSLVLILGRLLGVIAGFRRRLRVFAKWMSGKDGMTGKLDCITILLLTDSSGYAKDKSFQGDVMRSAIPRQSLRNPKIVSYRTPLPKGSLRPYRSYPEQSHGSHTRKESRVLHRH